MIGLAMSRSSHWLTSRLSKVLGAVTAGGAAVAVAVLFVAPADAQAKPPLGHAWPANQRVSMDQIDHSIFDSLLKKHVDGDGYVNYAAWKRSSEDRAALTGYLARLSRADQQKRSSREAQLAFWINAYNAATIEGILQEYPTTSIRNHTAKLVGYNIWKDLPLIVGSGQYSLEQIEHQVLRKMNEPRIHFAIVCASVGCPRLRNEAFTAKNVDAQLADNTRDFFSRSGNFRLDAASGTLHLSSILDWFGKDFGRSQAEQLAYLKPYLPAAAQNLAGDPRARIRYLDYDWSLNDQSRKPRTAGR